MASFCVTLKVHHHGGIYRVRIDSAEYDMVWDALTGIPVDLSACTVLVELAGSEKSSLTSETWSSALSEPRPHHNRLVIKLHIESSLPSAGTPSISCKDVTAIDERDRRAMLEVFAAELGIQAPETMPLWELEAATDLTQEAQREELQRMEVEGASSGSADPIHRATLEAIAGELGLDSPQNMSTAELEAATQAAQQEEFQRLQMHNQALQTEIRPDAQTESNEASSGVTNSDRGYPGHTNHPGHNHPGHNRQARDSGHHELSGHRRREPSLTGFTNHLRNNISTMFENIAVNNGTGYNPHQELSRHPHHISSSNRSTAEELPTLRGFVHCGPLQRCRQRLRLVNATLTGPLWLFDCEVELVDSTITGPVSLQGHTHLTLTRGRIVGPVSVDRSARFVNQHGAVIGPISQ
jgi:hypothetical protein